MKRLSGDGESLVVKTGSTIKPFIFAGAAFLWFVLLLLLTNNFLWSKALIVVFSLISLAAAYFLVENIYRLYLQVGAPVQNHLLVTPFYVIEFNLNDVRYCNLEQLAAINSSHQFQNRVYKYTQIKLDLENESKIFKIKNLQAAEEAIEQINHLRKLFIEATARNDESYLNSNNDFLEIETQPGGSNVESRGNLFRRAATLLTAAVLTTAIMFGAAALNRFFDDKKSWELANEQNRAASFRTYLQTQPNGRWSSEANQKLLSFYDAAAQKYQFSLNKGYDQQAADAILKILDYAKTTQNFRVKTVFERRNEIPPDIVEILKNEYEVNKMLSLDDTFSEEKMKRREGLLQTFIADAFRQIIPEDVLEISADCSGECVTFLVKYTVDSDSIYYDDREKDLPPAERTYNPGIFFDWDFGINIPNQSEDYHFTLTSDPAEHFSYDSNFDAVSEAGKNITDVLNVEKGNVYDAMAASAFDDFKGNLVFRMGIGALPKNAVAGDVIKADKVPTPTKPKQKK